MKARINDRWELELPNDRAVFHAEQKDWEKERLDSMYKNIRKGDVVVDIGTEVGDYAALFSLWGANMICVEPEPKFWPTIKQHFDLNGVKPLGCFAGFASDITDLNPPRPNFGAGNNGIWPFVAEGSPEDWHGFRNKIETADATPQTTVDDLMIEYIGCDIMTIDVEGAEISVLAGANRIITTEKPLVYVSIHPEMMMNDYGATPQDLFRYMGTYGYRKHFIHTDHEEHWVFYHPNGKAFVS